MELSHWDNTESPEQHWATGRQRWVTRTALLHWDSTESLGYRWVTERQHSVTGKALSHWEAEFRREYLACGEKSRWFRQIALTKAKLFFAFPDKVYSYLREFAKFGQSVLFVNKEARGGWNMTTKRKLEYIVTLLYLWYSFLKSLWYLSSSNYLVSPFFGTSPVGWVNLYQQF